MTFLDDDRPKKPTAHEIGSDLSMLSVDELDARITLLRSEIERLGAEKDRKAAGRRAADSIFKS
ncbi:DUF1192 domain-containing protein [Rhizobium sp. XQZ8]|uniref:DUF1192 domain-containing protein n=1 Tax=Rhizobium populisoli TaxID=2859785 RepID=UPI001C680763|nr:DUF1192 domain-containing protein [Rhizobium populisoli]MBW6421565.1 DUF1192 domain-containing protein [Rhizobium populisoli]